MASGHASRIHPLGTTHRGSAQWTHAAPAIPPRCSRRRASVAKHSIERRAALRKGSGRWQGQRCSATEEGVASSSSSAASLDELEKLGLEEEIMRRPALLDTVAEIETLDAMDLVQEEVELEVRGELIFLFVGAAIAFGAGVWYFLGEEKGAEFFAGYILEQSLSVDNLFVFILVFKYFKTPRADQDKVLSYGILSAAVLRLIMIGLGAELIEQSQAVLLVFASILLFSSYKLLAAGDDDEEDEDLSDNFIVKTCKRLIPVSDNYDGNNFFTMQDGARMATPLLLVLAVIELSDVIFAVDSIPAVFGVTTDPLIVYTSNLFAILSLRALYGFVATIMSELRYLDKSVAIVLGFVGFKMIADFCGYHVGTEASLAFVATILGGGVGLSLLLPNPDPQE